MCGFVLNSAIYPSILKYPPANVPDFAFIISATLVAALKPLAYHCLRFCESLPLILNLVSNDGTFSSCFFLRKLTLCKFA